VTELYVNLSLPIQNFASLMEITIFLIQGIKGKREKQQEGRRYDNF